VKIDPCYKGPVAHVLDASKSVTVASALLGDDAADTIIDYKEEYRLLRENHASRGQQKTYIPYEEAVDNRLTIDWSKKQATKPKKTGIQVFRDTPISTLRSFIDWTPFFSTWMLKGRFPDILNDAVVGEQAQQLHHDAIELLDELASNDRLKAHGVIGLFPANTIDHDTVEIYADDSREVVLARFHHLRQQLKKAQGQPNLSLADFIAPKGVLDDYTGFFAVTAGDGIEALLAQAEADHDDYRSILIKAVADRLAEAFAEYMHWKVRTELWGYTHDEQLSNDELIREKYQGIRPAHGYFACPDHTEKPVLFDLLDVEKHTGIYLTESNAMYPASSVSGMYFAHSETKYFQVGKISPDQVEHHARRKGMSVKEVEKWLQSNINYG